MQPYYFPYLGYWQLINEVDIFVLFDDVQFIRHGWVNRNRILIDGKVHFITIPLKKASHKANINDRLFTHEFNFKEHRSQIIRAYKDSPHLNQIHSLLESINSPTSSNLSEFIYDTIVAVSNLLGIETKIVKSSDLPIDPILSGQDKVLSICRYLKASKLMNSIGGEMLYDKKRWNDEGIKLLFYFKKDIFYKQLKSDDFLDNLSILDVLANNSLSKIHMLLNEFELV